MICFLKALPADYLPTNGDKEARTPDPYNAIVVLYQLSYDPKLVLNLLDRLSSCQEIARSEMLRTAMSETLSLTED
jgi:hypothetical protein